MCRCNLLYLRPPLYNYTFHRMENELHIAVRFGRSVEVLDNLIRNQGYNESTWDATGFTPLRLAQILHRHEQFVFLSNTPNAPINAIDRWGCTPLWHTADDEYLIFLGILLRAGCNPFKTDNQRRTARRLLENRLPVIQSTEASRCVHMLRFVEDRVVELITYDHTTRAADMMDLMMMSRHERSAESLLRVLPDDVLELISGESTHRTLQEIEHMGNDTISVFVKRAMVMYDALPL